MSQNRLESQPPQFRFGHAKISAGAPTTSGAWRHGTDEPRSLQIRARDAQGDLPPHQGPADAHTGDLAETLGVTPGTVTATVKRLADRGLVDHRPYHGVQLHPRRTPPGRVVHPPPPHRRALPGRHARLRLERGRPPRPQLRARPARRGRSTGCSSPSTDPTTCPHGFPIPEPEQDEIPAAAPALRPRGRRRGRGGRARFDRPRRGQVPRRARRAPRRARRGAGEAPLRRPARAAGRRPGPHPGRADRPSDLRSQDRARTRVGNDAIPDKEGTTV